MNNVDKAMELVEDCMEYGGFSAKHAIRTHLEAMEADRVRLLYTLKLLGAAFMAHTQWNGKPPFEISKARAAIAQSEAKQ